MVEAAAAPTGEASAAGAEWATLREGQAEVLHKPGEAFYNKAQVQNRDLSIAVIREFIKLRERDAHPEARVVAGGGVLGAGVAEPDDEPHDASRADRRRFRTCVGESLTKYADGVHESLR